MVPSTVRVNGGYNVTHGWIACRRSFGGRRRTRGSTRAHWRRLICRRDLSEWVWMWVWEGAGEGEWEGEWDGGAGVSGVERCVWRSNDVRE